MTPQKEAGAFQLLKVRFMALYMVCALQSPGTIIRLMVYKGSVESLGVDN